MGTRKHRQNSTSPAPSPAVRRRRHAWLRRLAVLYRLHPDASLRRHAEAVLEALARRQAVRP